MSKKANNFKIYALLTLAIAAGTIAFDGLTLWASYPTDEHRQVSKSITELSGKAFGSSDPAKIIDSEEFKTLERSPENVYSTRMSIASGILAFALGVAVIVAVYRYLRSNRIGRKPITETVLINTIAAVLTLIPTYYITQFVSGMTTEPSIVIMLLITVPFALIFGALITFLVAKVAEWHYNRSHGFED